MDEEKVEREKLLRWAAQQEREALNHPKPGGLMRYALAPQDFDVAIIQALEEHLSSCEYCRDQVDRVKKNADYCRGLIAQGYCD